MNIDSYREISIIINSDIFILVKYHTLSNSCMKYVVKKREENN
jgi:hypothetical protein